MAARPFRFIPLALLAVFLSAFAQPPNDHCPGVTISALPFVYDGNNMNGFTDFEMMCDDGPWVYSDVVFTLTVPVPTQVTASLCDGTSFHAQIFVSTGGDCPGDFNVACNYNNCGTGFQRGSVTFNAVANQTYFIVVGGGNLFPAWGAYRLTVTGVCIPPSNDTCPGTAITSLPFTHTRGTECAANNYHVSCPGVQDTSEVVYRVQLQGCTDVTASLCGADWDTQLLVLRDGACPGVNLVACNNDYCGAASQVTFTAEAGVAYYLLVDGVDAAGHFELNVSGVPAAVPGDNCPGITIPSLPFTATGSTVCAANNNAYYCDDVLSNGGDVIYHLSLPDCHEITVNWCAYGFDASLFVRSGPNCPGEFLQECSPSDCGEMTFVAVGGRNYWLIMDGAATGGEYELHVTGTPLAQQPNDTCYGTLITSLPYTDSGNTGCAANDYAYSCGGGSHRDVVYNLFLFETRDVVVSLCGSSYDTQIMVRTGGGCPGTTGVTCNNDSCGLQSMVAFTALANTDYYLIVDGNNEYGAYTLNITAPPPVNDACPGIDITGSPFVYNGDNTNAATDYALACPDPGSNDVVFRYYDASSCHTLVTAELCGGTSFPSQIFVRTGGTCPGDLEVGCDYSGCIGSVGGRVVFVAAPQTVYYIIVTGRAGPVPPFGPYRLTVTRVPSVPAPADTCPGIVIPSLPYTDTGSTVCAGDHFDPPGYDDGSDVVYRLDLTECTAVVVSLCASQFDTYLSVRRGAGCPGTEYVGDDDGFCAPQSRLDFVGTQGTYWVHIGGHDYGDWQATGIYTLEVTGTPCGTPPAEVEGLVATLASGGGGILLRWPPAEGAGLYFVYRGETSDFPVDGAHRIATAWDTTFTDTGAFGAGVLRRFYVVTAVSNN